MSGLTILNKKAFGEICEQHLRHVDPRELNAIVKKINIVNSVGNGGFMAKRNHRFVGDIPADMYYRLMRRLPPEERIKAKREFFKRFSKFAVKSKTKYV